jgi:hypothetical protein
MDATLRTLYLIGLAPMEVMKPFSLACHYVKNDIYLPLK